jgi:hypothetical protein
MKIRMYATRAIREAIKDARRRGFQLDKVQQQLSGITDDEFSVDMRVMTIIHQFVAGIGCLFREGSSIDDASGILLMDGLVRLLDFADGLGVNVEFSGLMFLEGDRDDEC